jgi:hypothetical protein
VEIDLAFTRRWSLLVAGAAFVVALGCHSATKEKGMASMINMADPSTANQLLSGFHAVEQNAWRWTTRKFAVMLKTPAGSEQNGATLRLRLFIPDNQIKNLGPITMSADVDGHQLDPQTFEKGGDFAYSRPVPADALKASAVRVTFNLDKFQAPNGVDGRELGVVASVVGLQSR